MSERERAQNALTRLAVKLTEWDKKTSTPVAYRDEKGMVRIPALIAFQAMFMPKSTDPLAVRHKAEMLLHYNLIPGADVHLVPFKKYEYNENTRNRDFVGHDYALVLDYRTVLKRARQAGAVLRHEVRLTWRSPEEEGKRGFHPVRAELLVWGPHHPPDQPFRYPIYWDEVAPPGADLSADERKRQKLYPNKMWCVDIGEPTLAMRKTVVGRGMREYAPEVIGPMVTDAELYSRMGEVVQGVELQVVDYDDKPATFAGDEPGKNRTVVEHKPAAPAPKPEPPPETKPGKLTGDPATDLGGYPGLPDDEPQSAAPPPKAEPSAKPPAKPKATPPAPPQPVTGSAMPSREEIEEYRAALGEGAGEL